MLSTLSSPSLFITTVIIHFVEPFFFILKICLVIIAPPLIPAPDEHLAARTFISKNGYAQSMPVYISLTRLIKQTEGSEQRNKEYQQTGGGGRKISSQRVSELTGKR